MKVGIVGTGNIGGNLARLFGKAGHDVMLSFSRSPEKLKALADEIGPKAKVDTPAEAVAFGEVIVLSVHFSAMDVLLTQVSPSSFQGKVVIDTTNPFDIKLAPGTTGSAEIVRRIPGIKIVKSYNTLGSNLLLSKSFHEPKVIMPYAGDFPEANQVVAMLIADSGFEAMPVGDSAKISLMEPKGPLFGKTLTRAQADKLLAKEKINP